MARGRTRKPIGNPRIDDALALADQPTLADTPEGRALRALAAYVHAARDGYTPVPTYWESVEAGAVFEGAAGLWFVQEAPKDRADRHAVIRCGAELHEIPVDRRDIIGTLIPTVEAVAARLLVDELGARAAS